VDDFTTVPIPLDRRTRERLAHFAEAIDEHPIIAAARLLRDLLADDDFYNAAQAEAVSQSTH
jgi:hypothetical protein